jgi:hypothetical protein
MSYEIKKVTSPKDTFKVCKQDDMKTCFSKRGLPYKNALGQMRAIILSEKGLSRKTSKKVGNKKSSKKTTKKTSKKTTKKTSKKKTKN